MISPHEQHGFWSSVSRETMNKLYAYEVLLKKWQNSLNLVASNTVTNIWHRHFLDSAQIFPYINQDHNLACIGSGAGFPGLVLSILGCQNVTCIEIDQKKCVFLRTVIRELELSANVENTDIRNSSETYDIIVSRALATVSDLLDLSESIRKNASECYFLKGSKVDKELIQAMQLWTMTTSKINSISDDSGVLLHLSNISKL